MAHSDLRQEFQCAVIVHRLALDQAAVAVARVFTHADIRRDHQLRIVGAHQAHRLLDDAVVVVGLRATFILLCRNAKEHDRDHASIHRALYLFQQMIQGKLIDPRHRWDLIFDVLAFDDKNRIDVVVHIQLNFLHHVADVLRSPQTTHSYFWKHQASSLFTVSTIALKSPLIV